MRREKENKRKKAVGKGKERMGKAKGTEWVGKNKALVVFVNMIVWEQRLLFPIREYIIFGYYFHCTLSVTLGE